MTYTSGRGVVLASFGRGVLVQPDAGKDVLHCSLKGRKQRVICGDRVGWTSPAGSGSILEFIEPRRNLIERIDLRGRAEAVAANIDQLAVVIAPQPAPDWFLVDRYCAGAQLKDIATLLVVNKKDLGLEGMAGEVGYYHRLGLRCAVITSRSGSNGVAELRSALGGTVTLLVGQSGVGKSSIVNALLPTAAAPTAELTRDVEGRHTTTTARRYALSPDTAIVDAPGVRDFAPPASLARAAERGFVEIFEAAVNCRFNNCRHLKEPECAVREAVPGQISSRRYESYRRLLRLYEKLG